MDTVNPAESTPQLRKALQSDDETTRQAALKEARSLSVDGLQELFDGCTISKEKASMGRVGAEWLTNPPSAEFLQAFLGGPESSPDTWFSKQGFSKQAVVDISGTKGLQDLSLVLGFESLQALKAENCQDLADISALASLSSLEFVSLRGCPGIDLAPLAPLTLRHLDARGCGLEWSNVPRTLRERRESGETVVHVFDALDANFRYTLEDWLRVNGVEVSFPDLKPDEGVLVIGRADDGFSHFTFGADADPDETATLHPHDPAELDGHTFSLLPQPSTPAGMSDGELEKWRFYSGSETDVAALAGTGWGVSAGQHWQR